MPAYAKSASSVRFGRHVIAVLGSAMVAATLFSLFVGSAAVMAKGVSSITLMVAGVAWLGVFVLAVPATGFLFTLAWPVLRHADAKGWPASIALGGMGSFGAAWANHSMDGKTSTAGELMVAAILGVIAGGAYWWIARKG